MAAHMRTLEVGPMGNLSYLLWSDAAEGCVVIDPGWEPETIRKAAEGRAIKAILLTHGHFDHVGAVDALRTAETKVYVHQADGDMTADSEKNCAYMMQQHIGCAQADE